MKKMPTHIEFRMSNIQSVSFSYDIIPKKNRKKLSDLTNYKVDYLIDPNYKKDEIDVIFTVQLKYLKTDEEYAHIKEKFTFQVKDLINFKKENGYLDHMIILHVLSPSYSTFRGVVHQKLRGTYLEFLFPLPLLGADMLLEKIKDEGKNQKKDKS